MDIHNLNEPQQKAVMHKDGPMLVLAGAGSGKTKVLTSRISYLIESGVNPYNILAITFTNKAATEMKERVINLIGEDAKKIQISTFHSFGLKIIRENCDLLGYERNFVILDSDDALTVVKKIMKELNMSTQYYNAKDIRNKISNCKNELISVSQFSKLEYDKNIVNTYEKYVKLLKKNNSVDFDDLLLLPIELFKNNLDILDKYQEKYKYILIDEYQDTNEAQYTLTKLLANKYKNVFVVGDNDQAIYAFRGANYKNILNFENDYPTSQTILLEENYRSTKTILNAANDVIKNNKQRKDKNLWCNNLEGNLIKYVVNNNELEEASYVSKEIRKLVSNNVKYEDIAILYRTNAQSRVLEEEMLKSSIPYRIVGSFYFYNRKEIKDLLCYLRLINNTKDDTSLLRIINVPKRKIGTKTIENLTTVANEKDITLFEAIESSNELKFKELILELQKDIEDLSLTEIVDLVLDKTGMKAELINEKTLDSEIRLENLEEFKSITKNYESEYGIVSMEDFLNEISLVSDVTEYDNVTNKVSLMTVHSVKGLEFDYVFIVGMEEEIFPHYNSINEGKNSAIEEERRLCYVAITRAKKDLYILNAKRRMLFGQIHNNMPSRFIEEINDKYIEKVVEKKKIFNKNNNFVKEDMFNKEETDYKEGDIIVHDEYGEGVIVEVNKSIITVAFPHPTGIKKLMKNHKSISKKNIA